MNCTEFETAIELVVERRGQLDSAMLEHTRSCAECRLVWERHQSLEAAISAWKFAEPPAGFIDSVLSKLAKPLNDDLSDHEMFANNDGASRELSRLAAVHPADRPKRRSSRLVVGSIAGFLILAMIFMVVPARRGNLDSAKISPKTMIDSGDSNDLVDVSGTLAAVFSDLKSEYREMAEETTSVARDMVNAIPPRVSVSVFADADDIRLRPNSSDMVRIWKPIESRVESALGFLWQAVPSEIPAG